MCSAPGASIAGLQGPSGIKLYSPNTTEHTRALNRYLRYEGQLHSPRTEIAILATARKMDKPVRMGGARGSKASCVSRRRRSHRAMIQGRPPVPVKVGLTTEVADAVDLRIN